LYTLYANYILQYGRLFVTLHFQKQSHLEKVMKIVNFDETNSVLNQFVLEIRSKEIQRDRLRFRQNINRIGEVMAYEISKELHYSSKSVQTPLGTASTNIPDDDLVLCTILRAGLPFHQGFLNMFDKAESAFVSAYRKYKDTQNFEIHVEYIASPRIDGKTLIIVDPMLATGSSMELSYQAMLTKGHPAHIHIVSIIACQQALELISKVFPADKTTIWCAAVDSELNEHSYIIPGLGDAGDLSYGEKE
jgi:uracil phosphoribosyltransferase